MESSNEELNSTGFTFDEMKSIRDEAIREEELNLAELSLDELSSIAINHKSNLDKLVNEERLVSQRLKQIRKTIEYVKDNMMRVSNEIKRRRDFEDLKFFIADELNNLEGIDLLSEIEILEITTKMNKKDYRMAGFNRPRYIDFAKICKEVIGIKKKYPGWTLLRLTKHGQIDSWPPQTVYEYVYVDVDNVKFVVGCEIIQIM